MNILPFKRCPRCKNIKPIGDFYKPNPKTGKGESRCKACMRERAKIWGNENKERKQNTLKLWRIENREYELEYKRQYHAIHRDEEIKKKRKYRRDNPGKALEESRRNHAKYKERELLQQSKWRDKNREWTREYTSLYKKSHPEKNRAYQKNRKAQKRGGNGTVTLESWEALKKFYNYTCLCCKRREPEITLTQDHVLPLKLGGNHSIENIQPLCVSCNCSKHARHIDYR